ncbi:MAG: T9SS type A sorting domain-containing protein [Bacteroidota bacterium]
MKQLLIAFFIFGASLPAPAQSTLRQPTTVSLSTHHDTSPALRDMRFIPPLERGGRWKKNSVPNHGFMEGRSPQQATTESPSVDGAAQKYNGSGTFNVPLVNFEGIGNRQSIYPSDQNIDVGPNHVIEMVNCSFAIYGKSGNTLLGPADNSMFWDGFVGPWTGTNDGDPIVLYDPLADRWMVSQFSLPTFPNGPFYELVAVSQTPDPLGAWHRYAFEFADMPDYPKLAVWPDAYYMSLNVFTSGTLTSAGRAAVALERDAMLNGLPAAMVMFLLPTTQGHLLPGDLDGSAPPPGTPNYFAAVEDDAFFGGPDRFEVFEFDVDWTTPTNSTFIGPTVIPVAAFDMNMCGFNRNCIPQSGTAVRLDAISQLLMHRLQYRNFGTHQTLVTNHTVDVDGADHAGIRWYELRNTGSGWGLHQQGTYAPDANHRFMGSAAMDGEGSIAIGYSVSSGSMFPSIRYTGRRAGDPPGTMTLSEQTILAGTGAQTGTASRWGDYSMLAVDPADEMTFWYVNQYIGFTGGTTWKTRIASFQFSDVTPRAALGYLSATVNGGNGNNTLDFNECANVTLTLRNTGDATATSVMATLSTLTAGVVVTQSSSSYSDIAAGATGVSNADFEVSIDPSFVCGTPIVFTLNVTHAGGSPEDLVFVLPSCECPGVSVTGSLGAGDPTQTGRIVRDGIPSTCVATKACPGLQTPTGARAYDSHTYTNTTGAPVCVTTEISSQCGSNMFAVAYSGSFNPASLCTNYLADIGASSTGNSMSFTVPAGGTFVIVIHEVNVGTGCASYSMNVTGIHCGADGGGECTPVPIQLASFTGTPTGPNNVLLEWTTVSETNNYGFEIQRSTETQSGFASIPGAFIPGNGTTIEPHSYSYADGTASPATPYYRLKQIDLDGEVYYSDAIRVDVLTDAPEDITPAVFALKQNYPNPFNPTTRIQYEIAAASVVTLTVYDVLGQRVSTLVNERKAAGRYSASWDAANTPGGMYFCRIVARDFVETMKMVVVK